MNLVRKELHLLWPLAPLTLIALVIVLAVVPLRFALGGQGNPDWPLTVAISILLIHGALASLLAGTLSLGEERSLGLHAWNLTQPISVRRQWTTKLVTVVLASAACSGAIVSLAYFLFGRDFLQQFAAMFNESDGAASLALFPLLTFFAFWCATAVNGTVRAAFWCLPALAAVFLAYDFGMSTGMSGNAVEVARSVTEAVHPYPFSSAFEVRAYSLMWSERSVVVPALWVAVWILPLAAMQSYRLFRSETREGIRPLLRQALVLAGIGFLSGFLQIVPAAATGTMHQNTARALIEVSRAVAAMQIDPEAFSKENGYAVSLKTIPNAAALSDRTRGWFATDTLVIRPNTAVAWDNELMRESRYIITAELHGGWKCAFADNMFHDRYGEGPGRIPRGANYMFVCKSEHGKLGWLAANP
jgi:hypothetical protein